MKENGEHCHFGTQGGSSFYGSLDKLFTMLMLMVCVESNKTPLPRELNYSTSMAICAVTIKPTDTTAVLNTLHSIHKNGGSGLVSRNQIL